MFHVWAWDENTDTKALKKVVETYINETTELVLLTVNNEEIVTTHSHPFYSPQKGWTDAIDLRAGDTLVLLSGEYVIVESVQHKLLETPIKVYNFQVEDYHTYYVSDSAVLVHNSCAVVSVSELTPTHALTKSKTELDELETVIRDSGVPDTIKYVIHNDTKFIVDGHHRVHLAKKMGIPTVPAEEVSLPYGSYRTIYDLYYW